MNVEPLQNLNTNAPPNTPPNTPAARARREIYHARITAARSCRFCHVGYRIAPAEPITGTVGEISAAIPGAVEDQMEEDGWKQGACPLCAFACAEELHAEAHADDERDDWPEEVAAS